MAKRTRQERRIAMIQEAYCSFEVSKLLKEKGFPQNTFRCHYIIDNNSHYKIFEDRCGFGNYDIIAPTHQMAMAWLREVHNVFIVISPVSSKGYGAVLCDVADFDDFNYIGETDYFFHPKEAIEAALKFVLENLI